MSWTIAAVVFAVIVGAAIVADARVILRGGRWAQRRRRVLVERWSRDDSAYGDALAEARVRNRGDVLVSLPRRRGRADKYNLVVEFDRTYHEEPHPV